MMVMLLSFLKSYKLHILSACPSIKDGKFLLRIGKHRAAVSLGPGPAFPGGLPPWPVDKPSADRRQGSAFCCIITLFVYVFPSSSSFLHLPFISLLYENAFASWFTVWVGSELSKPRLNCGTGTVTEGTVIDWLPELV